MKKSFPKGTGSTLVPAIMVIAGYLINVEVQSYFGRQALAKADLPNYTLAAALDKAKAEDKLVLVDVSAIWCPTCRCLDNDVFADQKVREKINEKYVFSRLEYERRKARHFSNSTMPLVFRISDYWTAMDNLILKMKPQMFTDKHRFIFDFIRVYL